MVALEWPKWLSNAWGVIGVAGTVAFALGVVVAALRMESSFRRQLPWWWWIGNGLSLVLVSQGTSLGWLQGVAGITGLLSTGIGLPILATDLKEGRIRFRGHKRLDVWELQAASDWNQGGRLARVLRVTPNFHGLSQESPFVVFEAEVINMNLHTIEVQSEVHGRIGVLDAQNTRRDLHTSPQLFEIQLRRGTATESRPVAGPVLLKRNEPLVLRFRQHVLPDVRDSLRAKAGTDVPFDFRGVIVNLEIYSAMPPEQFAENPNDLLRKRLTLQEYRFQIPGGI